MILITGSAGFIGYHLSEKLLSQGEEVVGVDNLNDYYDVKLKKTRLSNLLKNKNYKHYELDIEDHINLTKVFSEGKFEYVINLAAQAGVRYSILEPRKFMNTNIIGFYNIIELCREFNVKHFVYASSSSVYGSNSQMPFSTNHPANHPVSTYAMTKASNELMAHVYSKLYNLPTTGLRYFTVYGPYGRPDMAMFKFTEKIINGDPIDVFNKGNHQRDFTYISDIVSASVKIIKQPAKIDLEWSSYNPKLSTSDAPWRVYNVGNNKMIKLNYFIELIENKLGIKAKKNYLPLQPGDVENTYADISELEKNFNFNSKVSIEEGVDKFVDWYINFYKSK